MRQTREPLLPTDSQITEVSTSQNIPQKDHAIIERVRRWSEADFAYVLTVVFGLAVLFGLWRHEMWRDELQGWLLARDAGSIRHLIVLVRREGHPPLWHLILFGLCKISRDPATMQLLQWLTATSSIYLLARFSPFTRWQKTLLAFGYFSLFEYGLLSRSYPLGVLLLFAFCALYPQRARWSFWLFLVLVLMANTSLFGLLIALPLALLLMGELIADRRAQPATFAAPFWKRALDWALSILGVALMLAQMIAHLRLLKFIFLALLHPKFWSLKLSALMLWQSYLPIPDVRLYQFWNSNWLVPDAHAFVMGGADALFALILLAAAVFLTFGILLLSRRRLVVAAYILATFLILLAMCVSLGTATSPRHYGHLFLVFIACLWLAEYSVSTKHDSRAANFVDRFQLNYGPQILTALFALHCFAGVFAWSMDARYPFSASRETAQYISEHGLQTALIAGAKDNTISPLSGYLDQPLYYLESDRSGSYITRHFRGNWNGRQQRRVLKTSQKLIAENSDKTPILLVFNTPLKKDGKLVPQLWHSSQAMVKDENFYLYLIAQRAPKNSDSPTP